jgi:hypothetical protein
MMEKKAVIEDMGKVLRGQPKKAVKLPVLPGEGEQVEVCVNGYWTVIRRGAEVEVPESVYLALGDAGLL